MPDYHADIANLRAEIVGLAAENLALHTLFFSLLVALQEGAFVRTQTIGHVFEMASQHISANAVRVQGQDQKTPTGEPQTLAAFRIVEELRAQFEKP